MQIEKMDDLIETFISGNREYFREKIKTMKKKDLAAFIYYVEDMERGVEGSETDNELQMQVRRNINIALKLN